MEAVNREGILVIRLCDRIDSLNADDVKKELQGIVEKEAQAGEIVLDAADLYYISSAGLRVILLLCETVKCPVSMIHVAEEIYDILERTGFTAVLKVERAD